MGGLIISIRVGRVLQSLAFFCIFSVVNELVGSYG